MQCSEFLRLYSDYRDGLIRDARSILRLNRHLATCQACSRYDASVREGVQVLRQAAIDLEPAPDFRERLRQRIAAGAEPVPVAPGAASFAALLMVAAVVALVVHQRSSRTSESLTLVQAAPVAVPEPRPRPMVVVNPGVPFVMFTDLEVSAFHGTGTYNTSTELPLDTWANLPR